MARAGKGPRAITHEARVTTRNVSKAFVLRAAQYPFLLLYVVLVPRLMGAETYGEYALLVSLIAIAVSVADFGLSEVYGRFVPEFQVAGDPARIVRLSSTILAFKLAAGAVVAALFLLALHVSYADRFPASHLLMVVAAALAADVGAVPYALVFGLNDMGRHAVREPVRRALNLGLVLLLFHLYGLFGALLAYALVELALTAVYFSWTRRWFRAGEIRLDAAFLRPYVRFGFTVYLSWGLTVLWLRSGNALVDFLTRDPREVAYYDMASQLFWLTTVFTLLVLSSLVPVFTKLLLTGNEQKLGNWSAAALKYAIIFTTVLFVGFAVAGRGLIPLVLGSQYEPVFANGVVLLLGTVPMALAQVCMVLGIAHRRPGRYFVGLCCGFATFLGAASLLIPGHAALGCSLATLLGCVALAGAMALAFRRELGHALAGAARAAGLGLVFAPLALVPGGIVADLALTVGFLAAYGLILFATHTLEPGEVRDIFRAMRRPASARPPARLAQE